MNFFSQENVPRQKKKWNKSFYLFLFFLSENHNAYQASQGEESYKNVKVANSESTRLPRYLYRICSIAQRICTAASVICSQGICGIYVSRASDHEVSLLITLNVTLRAVHTERFLVEKATSLTNQFNAGGTDRRKKCQIMFPFHFPNCSLEMNLCDRFTLAIIWTIVIVWMNCDSSLNCDSVFLRLR